jgi:hypothetical protein
MPRGYRCIIIAAVGWLILAAAPAPQHGAQGEQAQPPANVERSLDTIAGAQNKLAEATDTGEYQKPCAETEANNQSDLCAQWYAAHAARDAADWAKWSLLIAVIGAGGIIAALLLTIDSNRIARDSAKRQLRAYLNPTTIGLKADPSDSRLRATVQYENSGEIPAQKVSNVASIHVFEGDARFAALPGLTEKEPMWYALLGKGEKRVLVQGSQELPAKASEILEGNYTVFVDGCLTYVDIFGETHRTHYRYFRSPGSMKVGIPMSVAREGNSLD